MRQLNRLFRFIWRHKWNRLDMGWNWSTWMKWKLMDEVLLQYEVVITIMIEKRWPYGWPKNGPPHGCNFMTCMILPLQYNWQLLQVWACSRFPSLPMFLPFTFPPLPQTLTPPLLSWCKKRTNIGRVVAKPINYIYIMDGWGVLPLPFIPRRTKGVYYQGTNQICVW